MRSRVVPIAVAILGGAAIGVGIFGAARSLKRTEGGLVPLEVRRVTPDGSLGDAVAAAFGEPVEFVYELRNSGLTRLSGLHTARLCGCQVTREPDHELPPGGATRAAFLIKPVIVGVTSRPVPFFAEGYSEPVAVARMTLNVPVTVPMLLQAPASAVITFVRGDARAAIVQLETLEGVGSKPWLSEVEVSPPGAVAVAVEPVNQRGYPDPELCRRSYRLVISRGALSVGQGEAVLTPILSGAPAPRPIHLNFRVLERLAIAPDPAAIVIPATPTTAKTRVAVVDNAGAGIIEVLDFDGELLDVHRIGAAVSGFGVFELTVKLIPDSPIQTNVIFTVDGGHGRELLVNVGPPGHGT